MTSLEDTTSPSGWVDVSIPLHSGMLHWPGDPAVIIERIVSMDKGEACNVSRMDMGNHIGTHLDSPLHFLNDGLGIDEMPPDITVGPARILQVDSPVCVTAEDLAPYDIQPGERILLRTRNADRLRYSAPFVEDYVYIAPCAARHLAERQVRCVGIDYLSVGGFTQDNEATHVALLCAGVWILEGLDLSQVGAGPVDLLCLPLRLVHCDGAPARAFVRRRLPAGA